MAVPHDGAILKYVDIERWQCGCFHCGGMNKLQAKFCCNCTGAYGSRGDKDDRTLSYLTNYHTWERVPESTRESHGGNQVGKGGGHRGTASSRVSGTPMITRVRGELGLGHPSLPTGANSREGDTNSSARHRKDRHWVFFNAVFTTWGNGLKETLYRF